jgi:hypothetical protein
MSVAGDERELRLEKKRRQFNRSKASHGKHTLPDFDVCLNLFAQECNTFSQLGREWGVTRENVRQIYNRYFRRFLPGRKSGTVRRRVCKLKRQVVTARSLPEGEVLRFVAETARAAGYETRQIIGAGAVPLKRTLLIGGKRCHVVYARAATRSSRYARSRYCHYNVSKGYARQCDFLIAIQCVPDWPQRIFIIPSGKFMEAYGGRSRKSGQIIDFGIPLQKLPAAGPNPLRIGWRDYLDAWHLLR